MACNKSGIHLNQQKYTLDLLSKTGLLGCKPTSTPTAYDTRLNSTDGILMDDPSKYQKLIGQLIHILNTRPDISYFVQKFSQHMSKPTDLHY